MVGWTNAEEVAVLEWYFGNQAMTPPASLFISLCTAPGTDAGAFTEIAYTGYAREEILAAEWAAGATGDPSAIANANAITFGLMTAGVGGTATHFGCHTLVTGGTMLFHGVIQNPLAVTNNVQPEFGAGNFVARLGDL